MQELVRDGRQGVADKGHILSPASLEFLGASGPVLSPKIVVLGEATLHDNNPLVWPGSTQNSLGAPLHLSNPR